MLMFCCPKHGQIDEEHTFIRPSHRRVCSICEAPVYPEVLGFLKNLKIDINQKFKTEATCCLLCVNRSFCSIIYRQRAKNDGYCRQFILDYQLVEDKRELRQFESSLINRLMEGKI